MRGADGQQVGDARETPPAGLLAALIAVLMAAATTSTAPALAFTLRSDPSVTLDGKSILSPSAERVATVRPAPAGGPEVGPGMKIKREVVLQNRNRQPVTYDLDVAQVVGADAETVVEVRQGVREGAAAWVQLERNDVTLKPGDTATVEITIAIPKKVKPGAKPFAVTATQRPPAAAPQGSGVTPIFRQVAIFIVDLPGDAPAKGKLIRAELVSVSDTLRTAQDKGERIVPLYPGKQKLRAIGEFRNEGETLLQTEGKILVRNTFGNVVRRIDVPRVTVYPGGENRFEQDLTKVPKIGVVRVDLELTSQAGDYKRRIGTIVVAPWWLVGAVAALLGYTLYLIVRWALGRRGERTTDEPVDEDEDDEDENGLDS